MMPNEWSHGSVIFLMWGYDFEYVTPGTNGNSSSLIKVRVSGHSSASDGVDRRTGMRVCSSSCTSSVRRRVLGGALVGLGFGTGAESGPGLAAG